MVNFYPLFQRKVYTTFLLSKFEIQSADVTGRIWKCIAKKLSISASASYGPEFGGNNY